jgi:MFS family permease
MPRNVRLLYIHNFLSDFRFQEAFLVIRFAEITGSYTAAMTVLAAVSLISAVMDIPTGIFSDRIGRRATFMLASLCAVGMAVCYASADGLIVLYLGAVFSGISQALFSGNNNALLYESLKAEQREKDFSHYQGRATSMYQLALCLSAFAASLLAKDGLKLVFLLGIAPQVLALIVASLFKEPRLHIDHEPNRLRHLTSACGEIWRNPRLRWITLGQAISYGAGESNFNFKFAFVATLWPVWAVALYRGLNHACGFLGFWFATPILRRIRGPQYLALRDAYWVVTQSIAIALHNIATPLIILTSAFVYGPGEVARERVLQSEFTDHQRATMASVGSFVASLFYAVIAVFIGLIADRFGITAGVVFGIGVSATSFPVYVYLFRRHF